MMNEHNLTFADPDSTKDLVARVLKFWRNAIAIEVEMNDKVLLLKSFDRTLLEKNEIVSKERRQNDDSKNNARS